MQNTGKLVTARNARTNPPNTTSVDGEVNTNCWQELSDTEHRQRESNNCTTRLVRYLLLAGRMGCGFPGAGRRGCTLRHLVHNIFRLHGARSMVPNIAYVTTRGVLPPFPHHTVMMRFFGTITEYSGFVPKFAWWTFNWDSR